MMPSVEKKYKKLEKQLSAIGYVCMGSINTVYTRCGNAYCDCSQDVSKRHGPYYLWTKKKNGKTISKRLSRKQVTVCRKFIKNYKKLKIILEKMKDISMKIICKNCVKNC